MSICVGSEEAGTQFIRNQSHLYGCLSLTGNQQLIRYLSPVDLPCLSVWAVRKLGPSLKVFDWSLQVSVWVVRKLGPSS